MNPQVSIYSFSTHVTDLEDCYLIDWRAKYCCTHAGLEASRSHWQSGTLGAKRE